MKAGHFQPFVSRRATAMVDRHWGANTNQARKGERGRQRPAAAELLRQRLFGGGLIGASIE
jgi:hypothetical protein